MTPCSKTKLYKAVVKQLKANGYEGDYLDDVKKNLIIVFNTLVHSHYSFEIPDIAGAFTWSSTPQGTEYWYDVYKRTFS